MINRTAQKKLTMLVSITKYVRPSVLFPARIDTV